MSTFTPNKNLEMPANGSYNNDWQIPVNQTTDTIDTALGGVCFYSVTGNTSALVLLTLAQYTPPNIIFSGTLTQTTFFIIPTGVGGVWSIGNFTTGAFNLWFNTNAGLSVLCTQGYNTLCKSDGTNMRPGDDGTAYLAQLQAQAAAQGYANTAQSNAESYAASQAAAAQANAEAFAANGSNISSGVVNKNNLPLAGTLNGITIAADPGTTPSGSFGDIFYYY